VVNPIQTTAYKYFPPELQVPEERISVTFQEHQQQLRGFVLSCSSISIVRGVLHSATERETGTCLCEQVYYELETATHDVVNGKIHCCSEFSLSRTTTLNEPIFQTNTALINEFVSTLRPN